MLRPGVVNANCGRVELDSTSGRLNSSRSAPDRVGDYHYSSRRVFELQKTIMRGIPPGITFFFLPFSLRRFRNTRVAVDTLQTADFHPFGYGKHV